MFFFVWILIFQFHTSFSLSSSVTTKTSCWPSIPIHRRKKINHYFHSNSIRRGFFLIETYKLLFTLATVKRVNGNGNFYDEAFESEPLAATKAYSFALSIFIFRTFYFPPLLSIYTETNCRQCDKLNNKSRFTFSFKKAFCLLNGMNATKAMKICIIHISLNHSLFHRELFSCIGERYIHVFNENEFD